MNWSIPGATNARVFAFSGSLLALLYLMTIQRLAGELLVAVLTFVGEL